HRRGKAERPNLSGPRTDGACSGASLNATATFDCPPGLGMATSDLRRTPLYALHASLGAKMVPFAGYEMPVQYPTGIIKEHLHTRAAAGLFDVSHMGQAFLTGAGGDTALERLTPADIVGLKPGQIRYALLLND